MGEGVMVEEVVEETIIGEVTGKEAEIPGQRGRIEEDRFFECSAVDTIPF